MGASVGGAEKLTHAADHRFSRQLSKLGVNRMSHANPALWWQELHKTAKMTSTGFGGTVHRTDGFGTASRKPMFWGSSSNGTINRHKRKFGLNQRLAETSVSE